MPLTDDQTEVLARDLLTIARCARALHAQLQPGSNANDGVWHRPVYGPRPPCSITVLDLLHEADQVLAGWLGNLAHDYLGEEIPGADEPPREWAARRDRTTHAKANRLYEQRHLLATREYAATAADEIHVDRNSVLGSIGVISAGFGFAEGLAPDEFTKTAVTVTARQMEESICMTT